MVYHALFVFSCSRDQTKIQLFEILRSLEAVPGVQIETGAEVKTPATLRMPDEDEEMNDPDRRGSGRNLCSIYSVILFLRVKSGRPGITHSRNTFGVSELVFA